jgi:uncharacterized protein (UPF0262 family)
VSAIVNSAKPDFRVASVSLDEKSVLKRAKEIEQERAIAIRDLLEKNHFAPYGSPGGPYDLILAIVENRLVFDIRLGGDAEHKKVVLSLTPFRRVVKDYFMICESYYAAVRDAPAQIEAIDMGRRGLHDEGAAILRERLGGKVEMDNDTARRLFTLICVLHLKGGAA